MWINHHRLFNLIKLSDNGLLVFNLLLLLFIVFVPSPTALLTQYLKPGYRLPAVIYSATFVILAICFNLLSRTVCSVETPIHTQCKQSHNSTDGVPYST
ncbi:MAG TPA: TMEM175 family protein [Ktedonobacteraceae bacterium]